MVSQEVQRIRNYGKVHLAGGGGGGYFAQLQDAKLTKEHSYELNKSNRCARCYILKARNGKCSMGCDE